MFGLCFVMHYLVSFLILQSFDEEGRPSCFALIVFLMSIDCNCSVAIPHGATGWSAVCECGIFQIILTYFLGGPHTSPLDPCM